MNLSVSIKKKYKGFHLDVAFEVNDTMTGILGASGCGKSMTLKCIAGIITPDEGRIVLNGRVLFDSKQKINIKPQQRRVGYLFQSYALFPNMTVAQNIASGYNGNKKEKECVVNELLTSFSLQGLEHRYPSQLSGGQQQRVALARILANRPEVMLLDEPFSALDAHLKEGLQVEMKELLQQYQGPVLMVTHNRDEAYNLCENLIVLGNGSVLAADNTKDMFKNPGCKEVARLTGCKNFSKVTIKENNILYATEWGFFLDVGKTISPNITHIGIRAHDFFPAEQMSKTNSFAVLLQESIESPFEWNYILKNASAPSFKKIWWKCPKSNLPDSMPKFLSVAPENILLLCE